MKKLLVLFLLLLFPAIAMAQTVVIGNEPNIPVKTVATLPVTGGFVGRQMYVSDGTSASDCLTGSGSTLALCAWNGSAWTAMSGGVGGSGCVPAGANNRAITDDGAGGCVSEANLTFDGSTLTVTGTADATVKVTSAFFAPRSGTLASAGWLRQANNATIFASRNQANSADHSWKLNTSNQWETDAPIFINCASCYTNLSSQSDSTTTGDFWRNSTLLKFYDGTAARTLASSVNKLDFFAATTSAELASVLSDESGSGGGFLRATSPTITTPTIAGATGTGVHDYGGATSWTIPKAAGAAPTADGDIRYDTTQDAWKGGGAGAITGAFPRVLAMTNCTTEGNCTTQADATGTGGNQNTASGTGGTTELIFASKITIPANFLVSKKAVMVCASMEFTTSASPPTDLVKLRAGATTIYSTTTAAHLSVSITSRSNMFCWFVQGTAAPGASVAVETSGTISATWGGAAMANNTAQPVNLATNGSLDLQISLTWGAATAGNNVILRQFFAVEMN